MVNIETDNSIKARCVCIHRPILVGLASVDTEQVFLHFIQSNLDS